MPDTDILTTCHWLHCFVYDVLDNAKPTSHVAFETRLRWDKADLLSYYAFTGCKLQELLHKLDTFEVDNIGESEMQLFIESINNDIVSVLTEGA